MKLRSVRSRVLLFIAVIVILSVLAQVDIFVNGLIYKADGTYHHFLETEAKLAALITREQAALRNAADFQSAIEDYRSLEADLQHIRGLVGPLPLADRQKLFEALFDTTRQMEHHHEQLHQLLPNLIKSVRYIHEHHIAYLKNVMRRGHEAQDYDIGPEFRRSPVKAAPELDTIQMAVAIQTRLLELSELFNRVPHGEPPSKLKVSFQTYIQQFYKAVNTFEDYSLDAQDGLLVEELLITGRLFETAFTNLLTGESDMEAFTTLLNDNRDLLSGRFEEVRHHVDIERKRQVSILRTLQYIGALGFLALVVVLLYNMRRLNNAFKRTVQRTQHIQSNLDYQIPIQDDEALEFQIVGEALNAMARTINKQVIDLKMARGELSQRVRSRTAALEHANRMLKREIKDRETAECQRIELETQLNRAKKMEAIGTLAGGVAHDLNNILSGIVSYPDLILNSLPADHRLRSSIKTIKLSGEKAAAIVQDLLTLARRGVKVADVIDLRKVVDSYLQSPEFKHLETENPHVRFVYDFQVEKAIIQGSNVHLEKTVMNLVSNAVEAIAGDGTVTIALQSVYVDTVLKGYDVVNEGDYIKLTVTDDGIGIGEQDLERIFEPFFTKKKMGRSGTGLGMAVVWGTVKDHNGYIDVHSREGRGTSFSLYFPMSRDIAKSAKPALQWDRIKGNGQSILVVDDMPEQREIAVMILSRLGYRVVAVPSGEAAIEYVTHDPVNLLLLDMIMSPGMDGLDTYKQILEIRPGIPAVIASGFSETDRVREAQKLGASRYIRKPYTIENIAIAVQEAFNTCPDAVIN